MARQAIRRRKKINMKFTTDNRGKYIAVLCGEMLIEKLLIMSISEGDFVFSTKPNREP